MDQPKSFVPKPLALAGIAANSGVEGPTHEVDRTGWPAGPWDDEPEDRIEWRDGATGIPCLMVRARNHGAWCGYAAVPPGHAWHGAHYLDGRLDDVDVHGGLTYSEACAGVVCHVPAEGEPEDVWWLGFDCSHAFDVSPGYLGRLVTVPGSRYASREYVRGQVAKLAAQIASAS